MLKKTFVKGAEYALTIVPEGSWSCQIDAIKKAILWLKSKYRKNVRSANDVKLIVRIWPFFIRSKGLVPHLIGRSRCSERKKVEQGPKAPSPSAL